MSSADLDWSIEGLIQFLSSPIWRCNIEEFIDQNCLIFDTADENKFSYTDVHCEYKTTVEGLLERFFLQELNMTLPQLLSACSDGMASRVQFKELFEPLLAVDDFLLFKSIMVRNNIRLNRQAEECLQLKGFSEQSMHEYTKSTEHVPPDYPVPKYTEREQISEYPEGLLEDPDENGLLFPGADEEKLLADVLLQSRLEYERRVEVEEKQYQKLIRAATEESLKCYEMELKRSSTEHQLVTYFIAAEPGSTQSVTNDPQSVTSDPQSVTSDPQSVTDVIADDTSSPINTGLITSSVPSALASPKTAPAEESAVRWLETAKAEAMIHEDPSVSQASSQQEERRSDLQKREDYLRRQRDSILAKKKKERETELKIFLQSNPQYSTMEHTTPSVVDPMVPVVNPMVPVVNPMVPVVNPMVPVVNPMVPVVNPLAAPSTDIPSAIDSQSRPVERKRLSLKSTKKPVLTPDVADKVNQ